MTKYKISINKYLAIFLSLALYHAHANAQSPNEDASSRFYIATGISKLNLEASLNGFLKDIEIEREDGTSIRAGVMFNSNFGLEASYFRFSDARLTGEEAIRFNFAGIIDIPIDVAVDITGLGLSMVGKITANIVDFYVIGGLAHIEAEATASAFSNTANVRDETFAPLAAAGIDLKVGMVDIFADYTHIFGIDELVRMNLITLGVKLNF